MTSPRRIESRGTHHRNRRSPERRQVDPLQRAHQEPGPGRELPVRDDRAERRRREPARRAARPPRRGVRLGADASRGSVVRRHRGDRPWRERRRRSGQQVPREHPRSGRHRPGCPRILRRRCRARGRQGRPGIRHGDHQRGAAARRPRDPREGDRALREGSARQEARPVGAGGCGSGARRAPAR